MVDDKKIAFNPAVELSYLSEDEQAMKRYVLPNASYAVIFYIILYVHATLDMIPYPGWLVALAGTGVIYGVVFYKRKNAKKWRKDAEYGSACWG